MSDARTAWERLLASAITDPNVRHALESDPTGVLAAHGLSVADDRPLVVVESLPEAPDGYVRYLVVPTDGSMPAGDLAAFASGFGSDWYFTGNSHAAGMSPSPQHTAYGGMDHVLPPQ
jgi:hypothetical protein